jgi:hypothetical protein
VAVDVAVAAVAVTFRASDQAPSSWHPCTACSASLPPPLPSPPQATRFMSHFLSNLNLFIGIGVVVFVAPVGGTRGLQLGNKSLPPMHDVHLFGNSLRRRGRPRRRRGRERTTSPRGMHTRRAVETAREGKRRGGGHAPRGWWTPPTDDVVLALTTTRRREARACSTLAWVGARRSTPLRTLVCVYVCMCVDASG